MKSPNFGDELNKILWKNLIPDCEDKFQDIGLLGVGTLEGIKIQRKLKEIVVLGTGGNESPGNWIDSRFKIYFCRGPLTEKKWGCSGAGIADAAYLTKFTNLLSPPNLKKEFKFGYMPHHISDRHGGFEDICNEIGFKYISPRQYDVIKTINEINSCEYLITEALHGGIFADILNIPWMPIISGPQVYQFKWNDWCKSINTHYIPVSIDYHFIRGFTPIKLKINQAKRIFSRVAPVKDSWKLKKVSYHDSSMKNVVGQQLVDASLGGRFFLSDELVRERIYSQLNDVINKFRVDFGV
jgi:succinoglycan biosynthesis protein ExoV